MHAFAIGDSDMVTGFRLVGVEGTESTTLDQARQAFAKALTLSDLAIIIISNEFSTKMRDEIDNVRETRIAPLIVEIAGHLGQAGEAKLASIVSKTVGIQI